MGWVRVTASRSNENIMKCNRVEALKSNRQLLTMLFIFCLHGFAWTLPWLSWRPWVPEYWKPSISSPRSDSGFVAWYTRVSDITALFSLSSIDYCWSPGFTLILTLLQSESWFDSINQNDFAIQITLTGVSIPYVLILVVQNVSRCYQLLELSKNNYSSVTQLYCSALRLNQCRCVAVMWFLFCCFVKKLPDKLQQSAGHLRDVIVTRLFNSSLVVRFNADAVWQQSAIKAHVSAGSRSSFHACSDYCTSWCWCVSTIKLHAQPVPQRA
jgi:hypothetical protein